MPTLSALRTSLEQAAAPAAFARLYGSDPAVHERQRRRYLALLDSFQRAFPEAHAADFFSSPGRTEVGGNHTDHNAGRVLAAAVDLDVLALAAPTADRRVRIESAGYAAIEFPIEALDPVERERYTSAALTRGVLARYAQLGAQVGGFRAMVTSLVPQGSGLSSSAAYELLIGAIQNELYNRGRFSAVELAQIGQYSENNYFGKPSGLMDQTSSAVGGFVMIDFRDFAHPLVQKVPADFARLGLTLVIVNTGGSHANLNEEYAALEHEMKAVARALGGQVLREFSEDQLLDRIAFLRERVSDRAILRALHFFRDDRRVVEQAAALDRGDRETFLRLIRESGASSWMLLQNVYPPGEAERQNIAVALAATEAALDGQGAWRVHGGGFAGTMQAFVPNEQLDRYVERMEAIFGGGTCHPVHIREAGAMRVDLAAG